MFVAAVALYFDPSPIHPFNISDDDEYSDSVIGSGIVICFVHLLPIIALTDSINPVGSGLDQAFLPMLLLNSFTLQMHLHSADEWELTKLCIKFIDHLN